MMRRLSPEYKSLDITNFCFHRYEDNQFIQKGTVQSRIKPALLNLEGETFLPIFSTPEKAAEWLEKMPTDEPVVLTLIEDGREFAFSVFGKCRLMIDPYDHEDKLRFTELIPGNLN